LTLSNPKKVKGIMSPANLEEKQKIARAMMYFQVQFAEAWQKGDGKVLVTYEEIKEGPTIDYYIKVATSYQVRPNNMIELYFEDKKVKELDIKQIVNVFAEDYFDQAIEAVLRDSQKHKEEWAKAGDNSK